jgi:hypothetical protein
MLKVVPPVVYAALCVLKACSRSSSSSSSSSKQHPTQKQQKTAAAVTTHRTASGLRPASGTLVEGSRSTNALNLKVVVFANSAAFRLPLLPGCSVAWLLQQVAGKLAGTGTTLDTVTYVLCCVVLVVLDTVKNIGHGNLRVVLCCVVLCSVVSWELVYYLVLSEGWLSQQAAAGVWVEH